MQPEGGVGAFVMEGRIVDVNIERWTVDFVSTFDQKYYLNVQVGSPYMHSQRGEGIYAVPEVGAKCMLCIPSDGPPPFILSFIMPLETIPDTRTDESSAGPSTGKGAVENPTPSDASLAGGRARAKPGDIYLKGRDGNFAILHRGGVLQIGSTAMAQRLYIPLGNIITDISQSYHHYNVGGAINWEVSSGPSEENPHTTWKQTFRLRANEELASVRVAVGSLKDLVGPPIGQVGFNQIGAEQIGASANPVIYEVTFSPEQLENDSGAPASGANKATRLQFAFDKAGGAYLWSAGSVVLAVKKKLRIVADDDIIVESKTQIQFKGKTMRVEGSSGLELKGDVVRIGPASDSVAHVGSVVTVTIPPGTPLSAPVSPGSPALALPIKLTGLIVTGRDNIKV